MGMVGFGVNFDGRSAHVAENSCHVFMQSRPNGIIDPRLSVLGGKDEMNVYFGQ
jgi:hypothetical protein